MIDTVSTVKISALTIMNGAVAFIDTEAAIFFMAGFGLGVLVAYIANKYPWLIKRQK